MKENKKLHYFLNIRLKSKVENVQKTFLKS